MAGAAEVRAGGAYVEFYSKGKDEVQKTMKAIQARMEAMGKTVMLIGAGVAAMGASVVAPFAHGLNVYAETAAQISQIARETGYTREQVSGLAHALGGEADALPQAAASIARFINEAYTNPSSDAARAINEMNLRLEDLTGADRHEQLMRVADGLASIGNETRRATVAGVLGLNPAVAGRLGGGRAQIEARIERGRELGIVRPEAELQQMETYNRVFKDLTAAIKGLWMSIGVAAEPIMRDFFQLVISVVVGVRRLVDANRPMLTQIFRFADILVTAGTAIAFLGGGIITASAGLGTMAAALPFIGVGLKIAAITIAVIVVAAISLWLVFELLNAVVRLFGTTWTQVGNNIMSYFAVMTPAAQRLGETLTTMWSGFTDAVMAGDLELSFEIAATGIRLIWTRTINWLRDGWFSFTYLIQSTLLSLRADIERMLEPLNSIGDSIAGVGSWVGELLGDPGVPTAPAGETPAQAERRLAREHAEERERARTEEAGLTASLDARVLDAWIAAEQRRLQGGFGLDSSGPGNPYEAQRGLSVQGTFNAAAVYGFAGAPMSNTERIAEATRDELTRVREVLERIAARDGLAMG